MNQPEILSQLYQDLDRSDTYQLIRLVTQSETITGQQAMIETLSDIDIEEGWITFPDQVATIDKETDLVVKQAPLEGELVTNSGTVKIRYLGGDTWQLSRCQLIVEEPDSQEITHLASEYREKMVKGEQGFLKYKRLWSYAPDKGMYIEHAVLQGLSGEQQ